jgi:flagellar motor switch/type III secretory pathway protein FliN
MSNEKGSGRSDEELAAQWGEALSEQDGDSDWGAALDEQKKPDNIYGRAKPVKLEELSSEGGHSTGPADLSNPDLDVILDIPVTISYGGRQHADHHPQPAATKSGLGDRTRPAGR